MVASAKHVGQNLAQEFQESEWVCLWCFKHPLISRISKCIGLAAALRQARWRSRRLRRGGSNARRVRRLQREEDQGTPIPPETNSVTKHDWTAGGTTIHYSATAGNLLIRDDQDKAIGSIIFMWPTPKMERMREESSGDVFSITAARGRRRSGCTWDRLGPCVVITQSPEATGPAPFEWIQNPQEPGIDKSDLVFIDAPLCGFFSRSREGNGEGFCRAPTRTFTRLRSSSFATLR